MCFFIKREAYLWALKKTYFQISINSLTKEISLFKTYFKA